MPRARVLRKWGYIIAFLCVAVWYSAQTRGQDHGVGHAEFHDQYKKWSQPGIFPPVSCCEARVVRYDSSGLPNIEGDCYPTDFRLGAKGWEARLSREDRERSGGPEWIPVPDSKIVRQLNPDQTGSRGHLCMSISDIRLLCAVPPTGSN